MVLSYRRLARGWLVIVSAMWCAGLLLVLTELLQGIQGPSATAQALPGRYIVVMQPEAVNRLAAELSSLAAPPARERATAVLAQQILGARGGRLIHLYSHTLHGFAAELDPAALASLRQDPAVLLVEPDQPIAIAEVQSPAPWNLDRIDQRALPLDDRYVYETSGAGVHAYIIDTGIRTTHLEFSGRVGEGFTTYGTVEDCDGHGTHVAGTLGGTQYGVAKGVTLHPVRVLDCNGEGFVSDVIAGIDWVTGHFIPPAVANMSLGGEPSPVLDATVEASIAAGVTYVVAAGNEASNACTFSPARVEEALTVAAMGPDDEGADFSNHGPCVDLFAPGVEILSAWHTSDGASEWLEGTSMAAPHVAGVAALFLALHPSATPQEVADELLEMATLQTLSQVRPATPNRLLFTGCAGASVVTTAMDGGPGSLRAAVDSACPDRPITFALDTPATLSLTQGALIVDRPLTILGPGAQALTIQGEGDRIFQVTPAGRLTLADLTVAGGQATTGGAIASLGSLTFTRVVVTGSLATQAGGGIFAAGELTLQNSTVAYNQAAQGGGIYVAQGQAWLTNSTLSHNRADEGGGLLVEAAGAATLEFVTVVSNTAVETGGGVLAAGGPVAVGNSLIATNASQMTATPDVAGPFHSLGHNFIGAAAAETGFVHGQGNDQVGSPAQPQSPAVAPLTPGAGGLPAHGLLPGSPAVDSGHCESTVAWDQQGTARPYPDSLRCDVGAIESPHVGVADLVLNVAAGQGAFTQAHGVAPGEILGWTVTYTNQGPSLAPNLVLTASAVPTAVVALQDGQGHPLPLDEMGQVSWAVGDRVPGTGGLLAVQARVPLPLAAGTTFTVTYAVVSDQRDTAPGDNGTVLPYRVRNVAPMARDDQADVWAGAPRSLAVLANDLDDNGDPLMLVDVGRPVSGTASLLDPMTIVYSATIPPAPSSRYTDVFSYTVSDGALAASAWVTAVVRADNRPPVAVDDWATVGPDMAVGIPVLANDWDPDGDLLQVAGVGVAGHGTAITDGWVVTYTAPAGFTGQDTFPYRLSDGYTEAAGTVWISVTGMGPTLYIPLIQR